MSDALALALAHLDGGRPQQALATLAPYVAANPTDPDAWRLQARALSRIGRHDEALRAARAAAAARPSDPRAVLVLAEVLHEAGHATEAVAAAERLCALAPQAGDAHIQLAEALLARRSTRKRAVGAAREAVRLAPLSPRAHDVLGRALAMRRKFKEAEAEFREALRLRPATPELHNNLGLALLGQRRRQEALEEFAVAARLDPSMDVARSNTHDAILRALRFGVLLPLFQGVRLTASLLARGRYGDALLLVAVLAVVLAVVGRFMLPPAARRYLRAYARLRVPTRERMVALAIGVAAWGALVAGSWQFPARDRLATALAVQAGLVAAVVAWAATWRRVPLPRSARATSLWARVWTAACDGALAVFGIALLIAPTLGRPDTEPAAGWLGTGLWVLYVGYTDGVLGASALRRTYAPAVVVDARTGERIGLARGLLRAVAKTALAPLVPFALLSPRRRAPHDLLLQTAVVRPPRP